MQTLIIAGDTLEVTTTGVYDSYTFALKGPSNFTTTSTTTLINVAASVTATWPAGNYLWVIFGTTGLVQSTIESGTVVIEQRADLMATVTDARLTARRIVDAIDATIEGRATTDQQAYSINGRSLTRIPIPELLQLRAFYSEQLVKHKKTPTQLRVQMNG